MSGKIFAVFVCALLISGCAMLDSFLGVGDGGVAPGSIPAEAKGAIDAATGLMPSGLGAGLGIMLTALATSYRGARRRKAIEKKLADHPAVSDELAVEVKDMLTSLLLPKRPTK